MGIFLASCSLINPMRGLQDEQNSMWSDYNFQNQEVGNILYPQRHYQNRNKRPQHRNSRRPRKYFVTSQDEAKYQRIQNRVEQRKMKLHNKSERGFGQVPQQSTPGYTAPSHQDSLGTDHSIPLMNR